MNIFICFVFITIVITSSASSYDAYMKDRALLVKENENIRFSSNISLNTKESMVNNTLFHMRRALLESDVRNYPFRDNFRNVSAYIQTTMLYKFLKTMPKGSLLHTHSIVNADDVINIGTYSPYCYINVGNDTSPGPHGSFWYALKPPSPSWIRMVDLREEAANKTKFDQELYESLQFYTPSPTLVTQNDMWTYFNDVLYRIASLQMYLPVLKQVLSLGLQSLVDDGLTHVEVRYCCSGSKTVYDLDMNYYDYFDVALDIIRDFNSKPTKKISVKWIFSTLRSENTTSIYDDLLYTVQLRRNFSEHIVGFDLVSEEDRYHTLLYYIDDFLRIKEYIIQHNDLDLPYFFHAGETAWNKNSYENLYDAVLLNTTRIGHGYALREFPLLLQQVIEKNIAIEVCPISNQMLRLVDDIRDHSAVSLLKFGVPITISSDDAEIYGYKGVTMDYFMATISWNLTLSDLKQLVYNSIEYSAVNSTDRNGLLTQLNIDWNNWIQSWLN